VTGKEIVASLAEELRDDLLTHEEAAALLRLSPARLRAIRHKLAAMGARYMVLPGRGKGKNETWRWSRQSLLDLARTAEDQAGIHAGGRGRA